MFLLGILVGMVIACAIAVFVTEEEIKKCESRKDRYARLVSDIQLINFARKLREKANKCEAWEEPCFFVKDIDEVLKEMVGSSK